MKAQTQKAKQFNNKLEGGCSNVFTREIGGTRERRKTPDLEGTEAIVVT